MGFMTVVPPEYINFLKQNNIDYQTRRKVRLTTRHMPYDLVCEPCAHIDNKGLIPVAVVFDNQDYLTHVLFLCIDMAPYLLGIPAKHLLDIIPEYGFMKADSPSIVHFPACIAEVRYGTHEILTHHKMVLNGQAMKEPSTMHGGIAYAIAPDNMSSLVITVDDLQSQPMTCPMPMHTAFVGGICAISADQAGCKSFHSGIKANAIHLTNKEYIGNVIYLDAHLK